MPSSSSRANDPRSGFLRALEAADRANPTSRKRLVGPDINFGREYLTSLARITGGWIGWEAATLRTLAEELAFLPLAERGLRPASDIETGALVNRALDQAIVDRRVSARFAALERSQGFRRAVRDSLLELRIAGVSPAAVRAGAKVGSPAHDLAAVLDEYAGLLERNELTDTSGVFTAALDDFDREAPFVLDGVILLAPALTMRGLPGRLIERLLHHGSRPLAADPVIGAVQPVLQVASRAAELGLSVVGDADMRAGRFSPLSWIASAEPPAMDEPLVDAKAVRTDFFAAATPSDELREVCRRVMAEGLRWDHVEIVATDVDTYGTALDALCQQLGVGVTLLHGVPLARTRIGRALARWIAWLEDGLPADVLRQALESGEIRAPGVDVAPAVLARELRRLKVGWGRARYEAAIESLESGRPAAAMRPRDDESERELSARRDARLRTGRALAQLLRSLLSALPPVPERGSDLPVRGSCAALARAARSWLSLAAANDMAEEQTVARIGARLEELAEVEEEDTTFSSALAALRDALTDVRAWPLVTADRKPWSAAGGMLHLTDAAHAGATGRPRTFVVGLDSDSAGGGRRQDPLLPDDARRRISADALATAIGRREEAAFALAAALASLRGSITLSYATSGALDGREAGPAAVLLQAWRLAGRDPTRSYESLRDALRPPASAVPARAADGALAEIELLDARDVWLDAMADGALLLDADDVVRAAFPMLDSGLRAMDLAAGAALTPYHGLVPHAGVVLDPLTPVGREISPSSLEKLAACPLSWFYRYALSLYLPDDPEYEPEQWLDALQRGSLLHDVFEDFVREYTGRQQDIHGEKARERMTAIVEDAITRWREEVPPPGETVFESEAAELRRAAGAFLQMERDLAERGDRGRWTHAEYAFGSGAPPGSYTLADGRSLALKGRADRVDELPDGSVRVIDYKTGRAYSKSARGGPFDGGRRLQPALYAGVLEQLLGRTVARFEYRFPTEKGGNAIVAYAAAELAAAREIVDGLLQHVRSGSFIPTTESGDCSICDHQEICRVRRGAYDTSSPRATWAGTHAESIDAYRGMLARRGKGGDS